MITGNLKSRISHRPDEEFAGTRFGKSVHHVLENVQSKSDLAVSVKKSVTSGYFTAEEAIEVEIRISQLFNIEQMSDWFSGNWEVLNEASILLPQQGEKRPDRVMIRENQVVVLDYKTGVYEPKHEKQVQTYMKYLSEMGYHNVTGYLLYLDESDLIEVRFPTKFVQPDPKDPVT
jgi:ATP-dependent exoDNAse (exonuclease V) beta subunit